MGLGAGQIVTDADLRAAGAGLIGRHARSTAISGLSAETGYMRIDNLPVRAGYDYEVLVAPINITVSTTTGMVGIARVRVSTTGAATVSSNGLAIYRMDQTVTTSQTNVGVMYATFSSTVDGTASMIVTVNRALGSGTVGMFGSSTPGETVVMTVKETGVTPADTGVDI